MKKTRTKKTTTSITADKLRKLLRKIPRKNFRGEPVATPWGLMYEINEDFVEKKIASLTKKYPGFSFRLIECHNEPYTYSAITIDDPDPREHHVMARNGKWDSDGCYSKF